MEAIAQQTRTLDNIFTRNERTPHTNFPEEKIALHQLVNEIMAELLPVTIGNQSTIINDIGTHIEVTVDRKTLTSLLHSLMNEMVGHSIGGCVRIAAATAGAMTLIEVKESCTCFNNHLACTLQRLKPLVSKVGGCISINSNSSQGMVVAFTLYHKESVS